MSSSPKSLSRSFEYTEESAALHLRTLSQSVSMLNETLNSSFNSVYAPMRLSRQDSNLSEMVRGFHLELSAAMQA